MMLPERLALGQLSFIMQSMIRLPTMSDKVQDHTAPYITRGDHFVPDPKHSDFWDAIYEIIVQAELFQPPLRGMEKRINQYFGYFGMRAELSDRSKKTFHTGVDVEARKKTNVYAMADGVLEHAGYGVINGKYVMLSHPQITTEDGFTLRTLYMHLDSYKLKFSSYQKMLRQISLNAYPIINVKQKDIVGTVGKTGNSDYPNEFTHVHIQAEFANKDGKTIHIDPLRLLSMSSHKNLTAEIQTEKQFTDIYVKNRKDIYKRKLEELWSNALEKYKK